jgi:hypothetical protein
MDSTSANLKAIANAPEPVDRLNLLSRWIAAKLEEIGSADERIAKRIEHLNATERSLQALFDALRKQVAETHPVLKELGQLRANAINAVEQVVRASQSKPAGPPPLPQSIPAPAAPAVDKQMEERIVNLMASCEQKILQLSQSAEESMVKRAGQIDAEVAENFKTVTNALEHRLLVTQQNVDALSNRVADQLRVVDGRANEIIRTVDLYVQEAFGKLRVECEQMVAPIRERLTTQLSEMETRLTTDMSTVEETMKAQINGFYLHMDHAGVALQSQLEQIAGDFEKRAETMVASSRQKVRQQIDSIEDEVRLAVRPILQGIEDRRANADRQSEAILAGMDDAMKIRLNELRRSGEAVIQLVEAQLVDKVKLLRPQAQAAIELAQKQVGQQLHLALENVRNAVELSEKQLADRIEDLRPRAASALQVAKTDITQQIASLEAEANTATGWIEQRLTQRIDELTYRARKTVSEQIRELDDAAEKLRRRESSGRVTSSTQPVELDIHVENPDQQRSNAA